MHKIKNILIDGYYGFRNLGDEAILRVILKQMAKILPGANITVLSNAPEITVDLHSVSAVDRFNFPSVKSAVASSDIVVIGGGGLFHEHYRLSVRDIMNGYFAATAILAKASGKPLYFYGIGMGPFFTNDGVSIARLVLSLADFVSVRDSYSAELARTLGKKDVRMTADPAFLLEPADNPCAGECRNVFLSLREWVDKPLEDRLVREVSKAISKILADGQADKIIFLPFQTWDTEEHNDANVFNKLRQNVPEPLRDRLVMTIVTDPQEMVDLISTGLFMIGERLHAVILSAAAGLPFIGLGYDRKVEYVCRDLGMSDFCLNIYQDFGQELIRKIDNIENNQALIRDRIKRGRKILIERALLNERHFREFINPTSPEEQSDFTSVPGFEQVILSDLRRQIEKQWDRLEMLQNDLGQRKSELAAATEKIEEKAERISSLESSVKEKDAAIAGLEAIVCDRDAAITGLEAAARDKDAHIEQLERTVVQKDEALYSIRNSQGWKALLFYYRIRDKLFPTGSKRRLIAKLIRTAATTPGPFIKSLNRTDVKKFFRQFETTDPRLLEGKINRKVSFQTMASGSPSQAGMQAGNIINPSDDMLRIAGNYYRADEDRILVIDRGLPTYDRDSGSLRMFYLLEILVSLGLKVTFLPDDLVKLEPYTTELRNLGIEVLHEPLNVENYFEKEGCKFSYIFVSRPEQAFKFIPLARAYALNSRIIYDTLDLHWVRFERGYKITEDGESLKKAESFKKMELLNASCSDLVITVTQEEKKILRDELPQVEVAVIPNIHPVSNNGFMPFRERKDVMFIGGYYHKPNEDAVFYFIQDILPLIKKQVPDIKFHVVGSDPTSEMLKLNSPDIIVTGYVKDVEPFFRSCRVFVAPLRYGAGMKGKIGQSMAAGLPVVTTTIGAEGIGLADEENALLADTPESFAYAVVRLYTDEALWNNISGKSVEHMEVNYSKGAVGKKIGALLNGIRAVQPAEYSIG